MTRIPVNAIESSIASHRVVLLDGATGTELERRGAPMHGKAWCAMATETSPDLLRDIHRDYIQAGSRVITANTFSTNRNLLDPAGLGDRFESLNRAAVRIAREARAELDAEDRVAVAGSMSHQVPVLDGADQRDPDRVPDRRRAAANFRDMAQLLADCGVDLLLMEMMSDPDLAVPAIEAALATGLPVWVGFSFRSDEEGAPVSYARPDLAATEVFAQIPLDGVAVAGIMHTHINLTPVALRTLREHWSGPMMAYPDSGFFRMPNWQFVDVATPGELANQSRQWLDAGARIIGGCCGLGVAHIRALGDAHGC